MLKKVLLTMMVVALGVFVTGLVHADQGDSLIYAYNDSGANAYGDISAQATSPLQGGMSVDGMLSGTANGAVTEVFVNPAGLGDALIYAYYNVRDSRDNYFNVVNTDTVNGVRARIRFLEAAPVGSCPSSAGSNEILDFDICLSPGDVWTGVIMKKGDNGALFSPDDDTYVDISAPRGSNSVIFPDKFPNGWDFKFGAANLGITADQTLEGYFIVIAEEELDEVSGGGNCGPVLVDNTNPVGNVLFGLNYMVDMNNLETFAYNATALADFGDPLFPYSSDPVDALPNLASGYDGLNGLNFVLTKSNLMSTYDLEDDIAGKTQMIVNFPTRQLTTNCAGLDIFDDDEVVITIWDDEERQDTPEVCEGSPCEPGEVIDLPYEVNLVDLNNSDIFTSTVEVPLDIPFTYGWININLVNTADGPADPPHYTVMCDEFNGCMTSEGLPTIAYTTVSVAGGESTHMMPTQFKTMVSMGTP